MFILKETKDKIKADWYRYEEKDFSLLPVLFKVLIKTYISPSAVSFAFLFWLRLYQNKNLLLKVLSRYKLARFSLKYGVDISRNARIGKGAYFPHASVGLVLRGNVVIGKNLTCLHGVTIGNNGKTSHGYTRLGDNCFIGAGAKIFGNVSIGNNVTIGGGAVVVSDLPDGVTVVGVPARIVSHEITVKG